MVLTLPLVQTATVAALLFTISSNGVLAQAQQRRQRVFLQGESLDTIDASILPSSSLQRSADSSSSSSFSKAVASSLSSILVRRNKATGREQWHPARHHKHHKPDDKGHYHVRLEQSLDGLPVVGSAVLVHLDAQGQVYAVNGDYVLHDSVQDRVLLTCRQAMANVFQLETYRDASPKWLSRCKLVIVMDDYGVAHRAWERMIGYQPVEGPYQKDKLYVSVESGEIVVSRPQVSNFMSLQTMNCSTTPCQTVSTSNQDLFTGDAAIDKAHQYAKATYNFYQRLGRDSLNGRGMTIITKNHYGYAQNYTNAHWDGSAALFGQGDGVNMLPLSQSCDVVAHELTHALTSYSSGLYYQGEPGALNEALSDIAGSVVDRQEGATIANTWLVADAVFTPNKAGDGIRNMANPTTAGGGVDFYPERYIGKEDGGGIHYNSGVANLAFVLMVQGGRHPRNKTRTVVPAIDSDFDTSLFAAAKIFYMANTACLTPSSGFYEMRLCTLLHAGEYAASVQAAWEAVGNLPTLLTPGVPITNISATAGDSKYFLLNDVPPGTTVTCTTQGGTGDASLSIDIATVDAYGKSGCTSNNAGSYESCSLGPVKNRNDFLVDVSAVMSFTGLTLTCTAQTLPTIKSGSALSQAKAAPYSASSYWMFDLSPMSTIACNVKTSAGVPKLIASFVGSGVQPSSSCDVSNSNFATVGGACSMVSPNTTSAMKLTVTAGSAGWSDLSMRCTVRKMVQLANWVPYTDSRLSMSSQYFSLSNTYELNNFFQSDDSVACITKPIKSIASTDMYILPSNATLTGRSSSQDTCLGDECMASMSQATQGIHANVLAYPTTPQKHSKLQIICGREPQAVAIGNGVALSDQSGQVGGDTALNVVRLDGVLAGERVMCTLQGGSNADLYVRIGGTPRPLSALNTCFSTGIAATKTCMTAVLSEDGSVYASVHAKKSYSGLSIKCTRDASMCLAAGQTCTATSDCCGSENTCDGGLYMKHVCKQAVPIGGQCTRDSQCGRGHQCRNNICA